MLCQVLPIGCWTVNASTGSWEQPTYPISSANPTAQDGRWSVTPGTIRILSQDKESQTLSAMPNVSPRPSTRDFPARGLSKTHCTATNCKETQPCRRCTSTHAI